jgi:hypothetical protein
VVTILTPYAKGGDIHILDDLGDVDTARTVSAVVSLA